MGDSNGSLLQLVSKFYGRPWAQTMIQNCMCWKKKKILKRESGPHFKKEALKGYSVD